MSSHIHVFLNKQGSNFDIHLSFMNTICIIKYLDTFILINIIILRTEQVNFIQCLTLCILMDSSFWFDTINLG